MVSSHGFFILAEPVFLLCVAMIWLVVVSSLVQGRERLTRHSVHVIMPEDPLNSRLPGWVPGILLSTIAFSLWGTWFVSQRIGSVLVTLGAVPFFLLLIVVEFALQRASG
jgi:hypothetical protein